MPLAMRHLEIAQNRDRHQYWRVMCSGWDRPKPSFKVRDCGLGWAANKGDPRYFDAPRIL